ncbi:MAG TPA: class I SAM-dependent methyltransferase [Candidatus Latescibacteria bacterium]|jgi:SAM-dependent methyltransferase|nr:hypothetical protein [Gemmatimonadaceae bacterium]MDP6018142.1 class I SAM-dependent methyltransferase [Candidatus Latescibacterota bacterium]HJP32400.1 class I SAM-dependent methyltransferase [Candidatus Latescibacterota bacterium]
MTNVDPTDQQIFWDGVWRQPDSRDFWTQVDPEIASLAATLSPLDRPDVLDLGCGLGRNAIAFAQAGHRVTAVDLSESAVASVREQAAEFGLTTIRTRTGRFSDDLFVPDSFDIVLAVNVLYHALPDDFTQAICHVSRWLRPGGVFYLTCPTLEDCLYGQGTEVAPHTFELEPGHVHFHATWHHLEELLVGFDLVSRKQRDHVWEKGGVERVSSRWQILVEKPCAP